MDTILYLYRWKQPELSGQLNSYLREDFDFGDYHLVKVGMTKELLQICQNSCLADPEKGGRTLESGGIFAGWRRKRQLQQEKRMYLDFLRNITFALENYDCVYEECIPYFAERRFNGYFEAAWVRHMLRYGGFLDQQTCMTQKAEEAVCLYHLMLLGQACCVPEILSEYARGIKSLKWILPARQFREEQQELVEMLEEEYGLAAQVRLLSEEESYKQIYPVCGVPTLILDFSEADRIPTADVAGGSIWLDMGSSEEKRRRIEDRDTSIRYFSLKKEWKQPQKALNYLDTIGKNGYNT